MRRLQVLTDRRRAWARGARPGRRRLGWAALPAALSVVLVFFWIMAGGDARYALRVLIRQDSDVADADWKPRVTVRAADVPRAWRSVDACPSRELLPLERTRSLLVVRDGRILCEWYGNGGAADRPAAAFSVSKTVLSLLLSRAVEEGAVASLDVPVAAGVPELRARDERFAAVTLADLLDMRSGIAFSEKVTFPWVDRDYPSVYYATDLAETIVRRTRIAGPAGIFQYNDYGPNLIGLSVRRTAGVSLVGAPLQRLWEDLGAEHPAGWSVDDAGFPYHESGFVVTARDLARIGQLMLDDGRVNGRQVAPRGFLDRSLTGPGRSEPVTTFAGVPVGYRNGWWLLPRDDGGQDLAAMGAHGQIMVVSPATGSVLVRLGDGSPMTNIELATTLQALADAMPAVTKG